MQRNIDSFFKKLDPTPKKSEDDQDSPIKKKKRKAVVISSSDEDDTNDKLEVSKTKKSRRGVTPTKNDKSPEKKNPSLGKLSKSNETRIKLVDPTVLFGGETKRIESKKPPRPKEKALVELEDDDIDQSLMEVDIDASLVEANNVNGRKTKDKTPKGKNESKVREEKSSPQAKKKSKVENGTEEYAEKTPNSDKAKAKVHQPDLETSVLTDEERHERKRMTAMLYQKYKNRSSCLNPGSKEVPKGTPDCLAGLTFLVTGVLESIERDEANSIIKEYGGKVMSTVGKRLNYLVVGEDAGPKKLAQADEFGITVLSEDGLFDLIREKSGQVKKSNGKAHEEKNKTPTKVKKEKVVSPQRHHTPKAEKIAAREEWNNNHPKVKQEKIEVKSEIVAVGKPPLEVNQENVAWVDKYKPMSVKDIVGQQGAASNVVKLTNWLSKWYVNHDGKKKLQKPNPWAKNDDGSYYKAALLSGPPGVGKTTTATLICQELGFDAVEFNASDTRSKRLLQEEVSELLSNKSLYGYFHGHGQAVTKKHVLIMDEVDGMAGNEDRGGIQELISLIKDSSVPIICMCNDRNHQKMRSLVNYCYDLRFNRPRVEQIKGRIMSILFKENIKMEPSKVEEIIMATNNDIRQSINHIALLSAGRQMQVKMEKTGEKTAQKDLKLGPWEVVRKVFSVDEHKSMSINDKSDLFFHDYSLAPLFVQQNYLQVSPAGPKSEVIGKVALTADALSLGDLVEKSIRSKSAWSLLPTQALFSSILPGEYMCGYFTGQINFPGWLGKYSRTNKRCRLAQEIHDHTRLRTSGSRLSVRLEYAPFLLQQIVRPLVQKGAEGVAESLSTIKEYHLLREDIDSLIELSSWPGKKSPMDAVDGRVKAALTRTYNKEVMPYSYSVQTGAKKKKAEASDDGDLSALVGEGEEVDGERAAEASDEDRDDDDDLENDGLIKAKKKSDKGAAAGGKASTSKAATSKKASGGGGNKGKAKK